MKIIELTLYARNINKQLEFYSSVLELPLIKEEKESFSVKVGESILTFIAATDTPFYHFAINIPSFQIREALKWIKQKIVILEYDGEEIINFKDWNAETLYFYDAENNIVEFIARKNLNLETNNIFSKDSLLLISEIGVPTLNIKKMYNKLNNEYGLEIYDGDYKRFCAIGDETGLFIVMNYKNKKWLPTMELARPSPFIIRFENQVGEKFKIKYENETINY